MDQLRHHITYMMYYSKLFLKEEAPSTLTSHLFLQVDDPIVVSSLLSIFTDAIALVPHVPESLLSSAYNAVLGKQNTLVKNFNHKTNEMINFKHISFNRELTFNWLV